MADTEALKNTPKAQLRERLKRVRAVMLGSPVAEQHMQPMAPNVDDAEDTVWFFAGRDSDLVQALGEAPHDVHMCIYEDDYQACLHGALQVENNAERIDQFWNAVAAAWFPEGKDDPHLTLLRFDPKTAAIWASDADPLTFAFEIAKANVSADDPDLGERAHVRFAQS